ncbi:esterase/lipase family protein [Actinacidiphila acidipaludis]|uniref:Alpha/beta fold hydrolase n=1 Tax=Actinacidiphila acidipaludis TaxID=2873382 RepID=A0ABS7Q3P2_9ACTN|nr:alpha/beta fold hydrolase [Streptomyces acidipaludis]MBY8877764.1 alpha/beta fold hydrolase [Streptomyces acidipaludis]
MKRTFLSVAAAAVAAFGLALAGGRGASAASWPLPVNYHFGSGFVAGFLQPQTPPPGAGDGSCRPSAAHPYPVVLVHGTFENMNDNWGGASPLLADNGYCVFAFDYGGPSAGSPIQGTGSVEAGAARLSSFVDQVLAATGSSKVDLVGHSQGGMMPRYYLKYLGGAARTDRLVALSPSNNGTTLDGLTEFARQLGLLEPANRFLVGPACAACVEQEVGSDFLTGLNAGGETVPGVGYTVITTTGDEVVTPYTSAFLPAAPNVTDITVQDQCPLDASDHLEIAYDPIALTDVLNALDPAHPRPVPCQVVLPVTGPVIG